MSTCCHCLPPSVLSPSLKNLKNKWIPSLIWREFPEASCGTQHKTQMPLPEGHSPPGQGSPAQPAPGVRTCCRLCLECSPSNYSPGLAASCHSSSFSVTSSERSSWSDSSSFSPVGTTYSACTALSPSAFLLWLFVFVSPSAFPSRTQGLREQGPCPS